MIKNIFQSSVIVSEPVACGCLCQCQGHPDTYLAGYNSGTHDGAQDKPQTMMY